MDILPKFLLLFTTAFIVIIGLYEVLIRRFNVVRLLFGLKRKL